jgi:hypothetical protein
VGEPVLPDEAPESPLPPLADEVPVVLEALPAAPVPVPEEDALPEEVEEELELLPLPPPLPLPAVELEEELEEAEEAELALLAELALEEEEADVDPPVPPPEPPDAAEPPAEAVPPAFAVPPEEALPPELLLALVSVTPTWLPWSWKKDCLSTPQPVKAKSKAETMETPRIFPTDTTPQMQDEPGARFLSGSVPKRTHGSKIRG